MSTVKKAVIPCAGFGTRFLPFTKAVPKELLPIVDTPALQFAVEECVDAGIKDILVIISPQKESIKEYFGDSEVLSKYLKDAGKIEEYNLVQYIAQRANISFAVQTVMKGSGDALFYAEKFVNGEPFAVLFGDDVIYTGEKKGVTKQLVDAYINTGATILGVQQMPEEILRRCGVMIPESTDGKLTKINGIIEKPKNEIPSNLCSLGRFILKANIFDQLRETPNGIGGELFLTDAISLLAKKEPVYCYEFDGHRYDLGNKLGFLEATVEYALRDPKLGERFKSYLNDLKNKNGF